MSRPLIVALHGVGSCGQDIASALSPLKQFAEVIALDGDQPFDGGGIGRQWFSISGVTEANRPGRVAGALPALSRRLDRLAKDHGVAGRDITLLGFSQGAILTLAMVAQGRHTGAAVAVAGRLVGPAVAARDQAARLLLVHDSDDQVMPPSLSETAGTMLAAAGHRVDLARTRGIGHGIGPATIETVVDWLAANASIRAVALQSKD